MTSGFQLPGAERFSEYLEKIVDGILAAEGPEVMDDRSYGVEYVKRWTVRLNGALLGEYRTLGPKPGETDFGREFTGRIPGYKNECIAVSNQGRPESERRPEDTVSLVYSNRRYEAKPMHEGPGELVDTPWQRQDGHDEIPFP